MEQLTVKQLQRKSGVVVDYETIQAHMCRWPIGNNTIGTGTAIW